MAQGRQQARRQRPEAQDPLRGFGGWLLLVYVLAVTLAVQHAMGYLYGWAGLLQMFGSAAAADTMRLVFAVKALLFLPFLTLAPLCHRLMPTVTIDCLGAALVIEIVALFAVAGVPPGQALPVVAFTATYTLVICAYLMRSRRVQVTYRDASKEY